MPLRDHFRPPLSNRRNWEGVYGCWPASMVQLLNLVLPPEYEAEPRVHLGSRFEFGVATATGTQEGPLVVHTTLPGQGNPSPGTWSPGSPTVLLEGEMPADSEYEVLVYDVSLERRLVAAIEIASPANKDRPDSRRVFVQKCEALLRKGVCVVIVDVVTTRTANLYRELAELMGAPEPAAVRTPIYTVACRSLRRGGRWRVEAWEHELAVGQVLPTLPLWLTEGIYVPLDLEASYEDACRALRIR